MKKILVSLLLFGLLIFGGCTSSSNTSSGEAPSEPTVKTAVNLITLKGPTGMGMAKLMADNEAGATKNQYTVELATAPDEVASKVISGACDIAAVPINLAAVLYNKTQGDITMLAVNTLGVLSVIEQGDTVHSLADLKGKTLLATGQGATPEYILNYLLTQNGLTPGEDVIIEYKTEHSELATLLSSGEATLGMLPEPNVTAVLLKNSQCRIALDLTKEWAKIAPDTPLVQGCIIARKEFIEKNPQAVADFLAEYGDSAAYVNNNQPEAAELIADYGIVPSAPAALKALPNCNIVFLTGEDMLKSADNMLQVLFTADPKSVGGKLPDNALYYLP